MTHLPDLPAEWRPRETPPSSLAPHPAQPLGTPAPTGATAVLYQQIALAGMRGWRLVSADAQVATLASGPDDNPRRLMIRVDDAGQVSYDEFFVRPGGLSQHMIALLVVGGIALFFLLIVVASMTR